MSTKRENIYNPKSCWNKARAEEPIFILRSNDELAPNVVRYWASVYLHVRGDGDVNKMNLKERGKYHEALNCADAMDKYKEQN
jgi:hypothetical protein